MRDALSLLDQCIAFHLGEKLTYENVLEVLGAVDTEVFSRLLRRILDEDVTGAIRILGELIDDGRELSQLVNDFTWYMRNLLLLQSSDDMEEVLDISKDNLEALKEEAALVKPETLIRYIRVFSELSSQVKFASQKRIMVEIAIIKLCRPQMEKSYDSVLDRINSIEKKLEKGIPVAAQAAQTTETSTVQNASVSASYDDVTLLAALIQCEAGNECYEGQLAVGAVVMNRLRSGAYPSSISGVIYQSGQFPPAGQGMVASIAANGPKSSCVQAAQQALGGSDNTGGATCFSRASSGRAGVVIGNHVFY